MKSLDYSGLLFFIPDALLFMSGGLYLLLPLLRFLVVYGSVDELHVTVALRYPLVGGRADGSGRGVALSSRSGSVVDNEGTVTIRRIVRISSRLVVWRIAP